MLDLTVAVPIPLVLFILVLALSWCGFIKTENQPSRRFWIILGFSELMLAFICFVAIPQVSYYYSIVDLITPIAFSLISMGAALTASLFLMKKE